MPSLIPDRNEIARFVDALFRHAEHDTYASLRGFDQVSRSGPARLIRPVQINGSLDPLIEAAFVAAAQCANMTPPSVFAPPIATFLNGMHARVIDLANGLALSVELDAGETVNKWKRLEGLLGPATVVMRSGGEWADPTTGELHPKLHIHWRLSEPTKAPDQHDALRHARDMACILVAGDPTSKPVVHPLRWAGSYNLKTGVPVLATIEAYNYDAEIHLEEAIERLAEAIDQAGAAKVEIPESSDPEAPPRLLRLALQYLVEQTDHADDYKLWVDFGLALYRSVGDATGFALWDAWSQSSDKYDAAQGRKQWQAIIRSVEGGKTARTIGAGTIFFYATQAGWQRPEIDWADDDYGDTSTDFDCGPGGDAGDPWGQTEPQPKAKSEIDLTVLELVRREPPVFPIEVLGDRWAEWVTNAAKAASSPIDYVVASLLPTASGLIGNARRPVATPGWKEATILWCASIGDSGTAKSPGSDAILGDTVPRIERRMSADFPDRHADWQAAAAAAKAKEHAWEAAIAAAQKEGKSLPPRPNDLDPGPEPQKPRLRQSDVTIEKVAVLLSGACPKGLLMVRDELAGFLLGMGAYNPAGRAFWLETFGGRSYPVDRQKLAEPIVVPHMTCSWFGTIQPDRLDKIIREEGVDDGLMARFLFFWPHPTRYRRSFVAPDISFATEALDKLRLFDMLRGDEGAIPQDVALTTPAQDLLEPFADEMQDRQQETRGILNSAYGKARGYAVRLALVLEMLTWCAEASPWDPGPPSFISEQSFRDACKLVGDYFMPMAERVYGDAATGEDERNGVTLARWIKKHRPKEIHIRTMQRKVRLAGLDTAEKIHNACRFLLEAGWLLPPPKGGQSSPARRAYPINPALWEVL